VPELGNVVKLKSVDVAIVWAVTAGLVADACDTVPIDKQYFTPSPIPVGLLSFTQHEREAQAFIDYLASPEGQQLAEESGLVPAAKGAGGA
jgi:ABC-type molybdate transport system substrate-binding protein